MTPVLIISVGFAIVAMAILGILTAKNSANSFNKSREFYKEVSKTLSEPEVTAIVQKMIFDSPINLSPASSEKRSSQKYSLLKAKLKVAVPDDEIRKAIYAFIYNKRYHK